MFHANPFITFVSNPSDGQADKQTNTAHDYHDLEVSVLQLGLIFICKTLHLCSDIQTSFVNENIMGEDHEADCFILPVNFCNNAAVSAYLSFVTASSTHHRLI